MRCPKCHDVELLDQSAGGGPLSSAVCARCGGGLIPDDGLGVLLEELKHTRDELRELAALYGGARLPCPACRSRMSPVVLRAANLDLCLGCGALWTDRGELELISNGRYKLPVPATTTTELVPQAQPLVRVDERTLPRHVTRAVLAGVGAVGVIWSLAGILPAGAGIASVAALGASAALSRRRAFDVMPRARRMIRWRGWFPPDARSREGAPFGDDSCVVVRRMRAGPRELPLVALDLVDAEGRDLVRLKGPMLPQRAWTEAPHAARALGCSVRFDVDPTADDRLDDEERARTDLPPLAHAHALRVQADTAPSPRLRQLEVVDDQGNRLAVVAHERPLRPRMRTLDELFAEHFSIALPDGRPLVRLYSTKLFEQRATILVSPAGYVLGHVEVRTFLGRTRFAFRGPQGRRHAVTVLPRRAGQASIIDGYGRGVGAIEASASVVGTPRTAALTLNPERLTGDARLGVLALAVHVSLAGLVEKS